MLHNLFHSLPCILLPSQDPNSLTHQICTPQPYTSSSPGNTPSLPCIATDPHHNICGTHHPLITLCLLDMSLTNTPSFLPFTIFGFFWYHRFIAHTFLVTKVHLVGVSFLIPFFLSSCQSICYRLSISYILTYQPIIDIYGFANFSFFWYTKTPYVHCIFFETVTFADIVSILFTFNVLPSLASWILLFFLLVSSASSASFFDGATHSLLSFAFYVCWLISTLPSLKLLAWTSCITTHTPLSCAVTTRLLSLFYLDLDWF